MLGSICFFGCFTLCLLNGILSWMHWRPTAGRAGRRLRNIVCGTWDGFFVPKDRMHWITSGRYFDYFTGFERRPLIQKSDVHDMVDKGKNNLSLSLLQVCFERLVDKKAMIFDGMHGHDFRMEQIRTKLNVLVPVVTMTMMCQHT
ncbi:hypothetical protein V8B97DRAFT_752587 [Scleroderma yunnanense]